MSLLSAGVAACVAVAFSGLALASGGAKTTVTIEAASGGFSGVVKSPNAQRCANDRRVTLYRQKGGEQRPSADTVIASDRAKRGGGTSKWAVEEAGKPHTSYYARAGRIPGCRAASSKTIHVH